MHHCWFNGTIQPSKDTVLHYADLGMLRGYGLFDYFRTYNFKPFQWDWYWERYDRSSRLLGIENPIKKDDAYQVVLDLIKNQGDQDCAIRFLLTGGFTPDSVQMTKPNLLIISEDLHHAAPAEYETGIKVISYEYVRDLYAIKSTDYKHFMILQPEIKKANASDVLFHFDGIISELSRSNVFIVNGHKLLTPDTKILKGITRRTVIELAQSEFEIEEREISFEELLKAEEVFTTSTTKRVLPISMVDDHQIGNGKIGPKTKILLDKINHLVQNY